MLVIVLNAAPPQLRGRLALWFLEVRPGVYVGSCSARRKEKVWEMVQGYIGDGDAVLIEPNPTREDGANVRTVGKNRRIPRDFCGVTLMEFVAFDIQTS